MADDPNLYGYCGQNPANFIDPTGHFSVSLQSGWGLVGASLNAAALITGDENLSTLSSVFSLLVAIKGYIEKAQLTEAIYSAAASSASGDGKNLNPDKNDNLKGLNIKITAEEANSSDLQKYVNDLEASGKKDPKTLAKIKHAKAII